DNACYLPGLWWTRRVVHWTKVKNYVAPPNHQPSCNVPGRSTANAVAGGGRDMRLQRLVFGMTALVALSLFLSGPILATGPKRGGTLRVAYGNEIAGLDFHTVPGYEMVWVATNIGCGLISITPDGKFIPDAAESWQISPDGLLYTFKLKK